MHHRIETLPAKHFIGQFVEMSLAENLTYQLWSGFMPRKREIEDQVGTELYSIEIYEPDYFEKFDPEASFQKWAAVEVNGMPPVPEEMEWLKVSEGLYVVFTHVGPAREVALTYQYIFEKWLPNSGYEIDTRPHLAIMGAKYKPNDADSEEELWIPIRKSTS
jgi:AraC family transcriptional regulator